MLYRINFTTYFAASFALIAWAACITRIMGGC